MRPSARVRRFRPDAGVLADALAMVGRGLAIQGRRQRAGAV
jgi:hypothetical protein